MLENAEINLYLKTKRSTTVKRYHISNDGQARPCKITPGSGRPCGYNNHIDTNSPDEARAFAEEVNAKIFGGSALEGASKTLRQAREEARAELNELLSDGDKIEGALDYISDNILGEDDGDIKSFLANARYSYGSVRNDGEGRFVTITAGEQGGFSDEERYIEAAGKVSKRVGESLTEFFGQKTSVAFLADDISED